MLQEASQTQRFKPIRTFGPDRALLLSGGMTFPDMIKRARGHSSQVGEAFLPITKFGAAQISAE